MWGTSGGDVVRSALAVFSLPQTFSHQELSASYRRVALRCHPDKGGRQDLFDTVRECYRVLHEHARETGMWVTEDVSSAYGGAVSHRDADSRSGFSGESWREGGRPRMPPASGSAFNVAEFNRRYDEGRPRNEERDAGYADWMSRAAGEFGETTKPVISPKSGRGAFNSAFERNTPALDPQSGALILHPGSISAGGLCGALFDDGEEVDDYTTEIGGGVSGADCRLAHGNQRLASQSWAREEVRVDRGSISRLSAERGAAVTSPAGPSCLSAEMQRAISNLSS